MSFSPRLDTGFSVLRFSTDPRRGATVPVGTVAWDAHRKWYSVRILTRTEKVEGITPDRRLVLEHAAKQLERWAQAGAVPYSDGKAEPWSSAFWNSARDVLTTGVLIDSPKAMEAIASPDELDLLFDAVVQPGRTSRLTRTRMEGLLQRAIGADIGRATRPRFPVPAYHHVQEQVMRGAEGAHGVLLIEAVNLAAKDARRDADALVSRMQRIFAGFRETRNVRTIIGYASSPGGLNGETDLRDWMAEKVTHDVFDVNREADQLRATAKEALAEITGQPELG